MTRMDNPNDVNAISRAQASEQMLPLLFGDPE